MAEWDPAYINDLPDSAFLLVESGGHKDRDGKTVPRTLRHFPVRNAAGGVDSAHLRNALGRIPQADSLTASQRETAMSKAKDLAREHPSVGGPAGEYAGTAGSGRSLMATFDEDEGIDQMRSYEVPIELGAENNGRTLIGRAVPYGETAEVGRIKERFMLGAFARQIANGMPGRVKLYESHHARLSGAPPIGKTASLAEASDGLHGEWPLFNTQKADDALELVRAGEVTGLSVGFKPVVGGSRKAHDGAVERVSAHLDHVVLTHEPIYAGAGVTSVRSKPLALWRLDLEHMREMTARVL